jgi:hypothetical protein
MPDRDSEQSPELFDRVVEASGLSNIIARAAVSRACVRAGVNALDFTRQSLVQLLPHLEQTLRVFLGEAADERIRAIAALAQRRTSRPPKS